jgi:hypothetical protein
MDSAPFEMNSSSSAINGPDKKTSVKAVYSDGGGVNATIIYGAVGLLFGCRE